MAWDWLKDLGNFLLPGDPFGGGSQGPPPPGYGPQPDWGAEDPWSQPDFVDPTGPPTDVAMGAQGEDPGYTGSGPGLDWGDFIDYGKDALGWLYEQGKEGVSALGGGNPLLGVAALALLAKQMEEQAAARKSAEEFNQQRLDVLTTALTKAEQEYDSREPLRQAGQERSMAALAALSAGSDPFRSYMTSPTRKAGEYLGKRRRRES